MVDAASKFGLQRRKQPLKRGCTVRINNITRPLLGDVRKNIFILVDCCSALVQIPFWSRLHRTDPKVHCLANSEFGSLLSKRLKSRS